MEIKIRDVVNQYIYADIEEILAADISWERFQNKSVMITGANGFIGYYLVTTLLARNDLYQDGITVVGMVRSEEKAHSKFGELARREDLQLVVRDVCEPFEGVPACDFVIHAASQASAWHFENDPVGTINANLTGTVNILEYAREQGTKAVLFVSSLKVYGEVYGNAPKLKEEMAGYIDHSSYKNCYAQGKRAAETLCASFARQYGMNVTIVRPAYIYGASSLDDDRVWAQFIANIIRREDILLKSNGAPLRSFCYVSDTAKAIFTVLLHGENSTPYNIAAEHSDTTIRDFAKTAVTAFPDRELDVKFANKADEKLPEPAVLTAVPEILDSSRLESLGWQAEVTLEEGIRRAVAILESQQ